MQRLHGGGGIWSGTLMTGEALDRWRQGRGDTSSEGMDKTCRVWSRREQELHIKFGCVVKRAGWRGLGRKLRSMEQNFRAERPSRSQLKSEPSFSAISTTRNWAWRVKQTCGYRRRERPGQEPALWVSSPASPSPVFWGSKVERAGHWGLVSVQTWHYGYRKAESLQNGLSDSGSAPHITGHGLQDPFLSLIFLRVYRT